jgi:predicted nucleotidyltransferase
VTDVPTIDIRDELLDRHAGAIKGLYRLSIQVPIEKWALVGGLMVLVLAYEHNTHSWRASQTKDADIVVDVVADPAVLELATRTLQSQGFTLDRSIGSGIDVSRCTFSSYKSQIDVLCPSDATPEMLDTNDGLRSVAIPGGRRALRSASTVSLYIADDYTDVKVRVPSVAGAIMVKIAAALDPRTSDGERHIQDVAFLLSLPFDLSDVINDLEPGDYGQLKAIGPQLTDPRHPAWEQCPPESRDRSLAAYQTLLRRSL